MKFKSLLEGEMQPHAPHGEESEEDCLLMHTKKAAAGTKPNVARPNNSTAPKPERTGPSGRPRPTNNQLLYKAHFRWGHEHSLNIKDTSCLPSGTDACASVTSCFLQVLQGLCQAEQLRTVGNARNILQMLSTNTRRTKVVELSSGTHRVPDELKKHYLSDGEGGQYSTNLDRNRYGNDDNYLFTVIKYDLEFLSFCPCMVDVEIIDAKQGNASTAVQAGLETCRCINKAYHIAAAARATSEVMPSTTAPVAAAAINRQLQHHQQAQQQQQHHHHVHHQPQLQQQQQQQPALDLPNTLKTVVISTPGKARPCGPTESPMHSNSGFSGLFDALVMAATGEPGEGAMGGGGEPPVTSTYMVNEPRVPGPLPFGPLGSMPGVADAALPLPAGQGSAWPSSAPAWPRPTGESDGRRMRPPPQRSRSRLWSALSQGDLDSLQNALDTYVQQEGEVAREPATGTLGETLAPLAATAEPISRARRRKPPRGNSSFLLCPTDSMGFSGLSKLGLSLGFKELSDDDIAGGEGIVSKLDSDEGEAEVQMKDDVEGGEDCGQTGNAQQKRRLRHVPRQFSSVGTSRVATAELKRMATEIENLRAENQQLREAAATPSRQAAGPKDDSASACMLFNLEQELLGLRAEVGALAQRCQAAESREQEANQRVQLAEERSTTMLRELAKSRAEVNMLASKLSAASGMQPAMLGAALAQVPGYATGHMNGGSNGQQAVLQQQHAMGMQQHVAAVRQQQQAAAMAMMQQQAAMQQQQQAAFQQQAALQQQQQAQQQQQQTAVQQQQQAAMQQQQEQAAAMHPFGMQDPALMAGQMANAVAPAQASKPHLPLFTGQACHSGLAAHDSSVARQGGSVSPELGAESARAAAGSCPAASDVAARQTIGVKRGSDGIEGAEQQGRAKQSAV